MANVGIKNTLLLDNNNRTSEENQLDESTDKEKEAVSTTETPKDTSLDMENKGGENTGNEEKKRKRTKKSKIKQQPDAKERRPLPEIPLSARTPLPQIHLPEGQRSCAGKTEVNSSYENALKRNTTVINTKEQNTQTEDTTPQTQHCSRASSIILGLKGIIMVAAIVLISSSEEISKSKSCDLERALKSISLNYTVTCIYDDIKEDSTKLRNLGLGLLVVNFLFFPLILVFPSLSRTCKLVLCIIFSLVAIFSIFMIMEYNDILTSKTTEKDSNYSKLQSSLTVLLENHYTSDNISSSDMISNSLNKFFIEYNCCAVNQVTGTTNDFDSTPWCTTAGSCQATASQIPKTCCIGVSEDDYVNALSICHSSVSPGTFRSNCMDVIKRLSVVNVEECQLKLVQMSLIIIGSLELVATAFEIMSIIIWILLWNSNKQSAEDEKIKSQAGYNELLRFRRRRLDNCEDVNYYKS